MKKLATLVAVVAMAASLFGQDAAKTPKHVAKAKSASPWVGTWKMDIANSKLKDPLKSETVIITASDDKHIVYHGSQTDQTGKTTTFRYSGQMGKDAPSYMGGKVFGKESWKVADANTLSTEQEQKDGTKVTGDCKLADDGKTMNCNWHFAPKSGDAWDETYVMRKS